MPPFIHEFSRSVSPEALAKTVEGLPGRIVLRTSLFEFPQARYSFVAAEPFLTFRSFGSRCEVRSNSRTDVQFGNPWRLLDALISRYELLDELDLPFPIGGCFGYWGYDLKNFVEPKLSRRSVDDLGLPDCQVGFYDSLVAFDHRLGKIWIVGTGCGSDGTPSEAAASRQLGQWTERLHASRCDAESEPFSMVQAAPSAAAPVTSSLSRGDFIRSVERAQEYIRNGHIYQVNLAHRLAAPAPIGAWPFYMRLAAVSPAPFSGFMDCGEFQLVSSSPEQFLRLSGAHIQTRPIKGTRPRSADPTRDAQLTYDLQTSPKEMAELVMITDLLRNDLGKVCEYGSVQVPELVRLERYPQVQHLVSTVEGRLRSDVSHFSAFASCFPGGSITGAPKVRAMEIIDELEPITRGPYTGALGYVGFNRESQLSILIRTAVCHQGCIYFHVGAGIVSDSDPEFEYDETLAKARGFLNALNLPEPSEFPSRQRPVYARIS